MNTNGLSFLVPVLSLAACGTVVDPDDGAPRAPITAGAEPAVDLGGRDVRSPLMVEAPRAATTPGSLFARSFATTGPITGVIATAAQPRNDIIEQRIVSATDDEIVLDLELVPPTGSYVRVLVSDVIRGATHTDYVLCESGNLATFDPRCETSAPATTSLADAGELTASRWRLSVIDDLTGVELEGCVATSTTRLTCTLPAKIAAGYRVIASADGFADLWDDSAGMGSQQLGLQAFTGAFAATSDWQCWDWYVSGSAMYCATRYEFSRFTAVDQARLEFDPISVRITANATVTPTMASPALVWDAGNADLPGAY